MAEKLTKLTIKGFKSIESLEDFPLESLNVLIGANGSGKSNFVDFFRMLRALAMEGFQSYVLDRGSDTLLHLGPKITKQIELKIELGKYYYELVIKPTISRSLAIVNEIYAEDTIPKWAKVSMGHAESQIKEKKASENLKVDSHLFDLINACIVYHFHDTTNLAPMRRDQHLRDYERLREDASNIAPFLMHMKEQSPSHYRMICDTIRLVAPFFEDFLLRPIQKGPAEYVRLEWTQKGSDFPFQPYQLSDGTMRFICLATALMQPKPPSLIVIDEPESGLHPHAISILADLVKSASESVQVILSTQSPLLLDYFEPEDTIVVNRDRGASKFERLSREKLELWLKDYSLGELWQKNVIRGGLGRD